MDAVYRIANILLGRHNQGEGEHAGGGHAVVEPEHPGVDVNMRHVQEPPQLPEYFQHCQALYISMRFYLNTMYVFNIYADLCKPWTYLRSNEHHYCYDSIFRFTDSILFFKMLSMGHIYC